MHARFSSRKRARVRHEPRRAPRKQRVTDQWANRTWTQNPTTASEERIAAFLVLCWPLPCDNTSPITLPFLRRLVENHRDESPTPVKEGRAWISNREIRDQKISHERATRLLYIVASPLQRFEQAVNGLRGL
ncbi:hypothetical protein FA10DRAFT_75325 [Acaromyces ingoldii]|uniref:Uncharacterized protein n=1 Tax=Acaromyces ingoldii TaxID=215250 RepID=A0A316YQG2_9BASI|nr:hypothetical protein FA10DRAFT_75325 [Acaromyces ingoldii]PWN91780.1 hypothetical protein FA10DRAFT_75325 [Acaromyces ingoldii]